MTFKPRQPGQRTGSDKGPHPTGKRTGRIDEVIRETIRRRRAGESIDYAAIQRDHSELMPELGARLRNLRAIEEAGRSARNQSSGPDGDSVETYLDEDVVFLRDALKGYDILERLHYGGQGVVYRAIQRSTRRSVGIKTLVDGPLASERQRHRFSREVELVSRLRHPNIVTVYESGMVRGRQYLAMEYVDGLPIDDYVLLHGLSVREIVKLMVVVCRAVSAAHQVGILHRDIKPSNILVDTEGSPHVLDFGLAKDVGEAGHDGASMTVSMAGQIVGTLPYLSPEQADGRGDQLDVRSDIYSLGVVLFELLTGHCPYPVHVDRREVLDNIVRRKPLSLLEAMKRNGSADTSRVFGVNDDLDKILQKALEKSKELRYQSVSALADDLDRYLAGEAVEAKSANRVYRFRKTLREFRTHVLVAAAFAVVLIAALAVVTVQWRTTKEVARIAQAGLKRGQYNRLSSVYKNAGRIDQAIAMLEAQIEVDQVVPVTDEVSQYYRYGRLERLATLYLDLERPKKAEPWVQEAYEYATRLLSEKEDNLRWQRLVGEAKAHCGRLASLKQNWPAALSWYEQAASVAGKLAERLPQDAAPKAQLASVLGQVGECHRELGRPDEAYDYGMRAHRLYEELVEVHPTVTEYRIELSRVALRLAALHMLRDTADDDEEAGHWIRVAKTRLERIRDSKEGLRYKFDLDLLLKSVADGEASLDQRERGRPEA